MLTIPEARGTRVSAFVIHPDRFVISADADATSTEITRNQRPPSY